MKCNNKTIQHEVHVLVLGVKYLYHLHFRASSEAHLLVYVAACETGSTFAVVHFIVCRMIGGNFAVLLMNEKYLALVSKVASPECSIFSRAVMYYIACTF